MNLNLKFVMFFLPFSTAIVASTPLESGVKDSTACLRCHKINNNKINVHLIPHSHDDVGWLKTVDQYFYGLNNSIYTASVQTIISSVVEALNENPDRRFIQVETAFFWKWWQEQSQSMRDKFVELVNNGQIEMVNGGWSMNDEACTNYQSTIDQFTYGLKILKDTIGNCGIPRIGWQIDPFGHSREQASIFAQLGYDGVFFARLDHDDKAKREAEKSLEFAWQGSANLPNKTIFGGIFPTSLYYPPAEFCWDYNCDDDSIDDDPNSSSYNLDEKVELFSNYIQNYSKYYQTNNVLIPMGGDFQFAAAESNYINMDKLIKAFKNDSKINVIYSTPSCYIQAVHAAKPKLNLKVDDFFPYSEEKHSFWTGYFSSRPTTKRLERTGHNILQGVKQIVALKSIYFGRYASYEHHLTNLREVMGTFQHHDAITGTEKQHVAHDYVRQLSAAIDTAEQPLGAIVRSTEGDEMYNKFHPSSLLVSIIFLSCSYNNTKCSELNTIEVLAQSLTVDMKVGPENEDSFMKLDFPVYTFRMYT